MPVSERKAAKKEVDAVFSARQWRRRGAAEEREEKGGSELRASATTGLTYGRLGSGDGGSVRTRRRDQWRETATSRPWRQQRTASKAAENGVEGEGCGRRCWAWTQGRRMRRGRQETGKEGAGGSASAAPKRKQERRKRPRSMAVTGGLMKTETRPTATEKSEGREDPHVVGDGKEEEGERDSSGDEVWRGSGNSITVVKEEKRTADGEGRGRRGRRDRGSRRWKRGRGGRRSRG